MIYQLCNWLGDFLNNFDAFRRWLCISWIQRYWNRDNVCVNCLRETDKHIYTVTQSIIYQHNIDKALIQYKMSSYQHRKSHCGDKTILRPSHRHNRISFTDRALFVHWIGPLIAEIHPIWKNLTFYLTSAMAVMTQWRKQAHCWQFCGNILVSTQHGSVRIYHHAFITHTWYTSRDFLLIFHFRLPLINDLALTFVSARKCDFDRFNATVINFEMS